MCPRVLLRHRPPRSRLTLPRVTLAVGVAFYAWVVAGLEDFTLPAFVAVVGPGILVIVLGSRRRRPKPTTPVDRTGVALWAAVFAAAVTLELWAYRSRPRSSHPTLSSLADAALGPRPVAALAFVAWLALGWWLVRR